MLKLVVFLLYNGKVLKKKKNFRIYFFLKQNKILNSTLSFSSEIWPGHHSQTEKVRCTMGYWYESFTKNLNDLLAFLEDFRCAMLCQTLIKKLDCLFVLLLLKIGVTNPGVCPATKQKQINQYRGTINTLTLTFRFCSGTENLLGNLSVILPVLSAHLNGFLTKLSALIKLPLFKMHSWERKTDTLN